MPSARVSKTTRPKGVSCSYLAALGGAVLILGITLTRNVQAQTVYVPVRHWVYDFLERMETKGLLPHLLGNTKPLTRMEVALSVAALSEGLRQGTRLTAAETEAVRFLEQEFREELTRLGTSPNSDPTRLERLVHSRLLDRFLPDLIYANGRNFLHISSAPFTIYWDPILVRRRLIAHADTLRKTERVFENTNGFVLWGFVDRHLGFFVDVRDSRQWGTRTYPVAGTNYTLEGLGFVRSAGSSIDHDETCASLVFRWSFLTLQYGKDSNRWGPGRRGQLGLSDRPTSYDLVKVQLAGRRIKLTTMLAWLQHYVPDFFRGGHQEKALAAHRLEFSLSKVFDIAVYETVLFAGRRFEPTYFNPVMFFRSAEHYLGDRDNATMGLDVECKPMAGLRLYGELFIDDLSTSKLGTGFYGNKTAFLLGAHTVDPCGLADVEARVEYARVRPYTYSHAYDVTRYTHYATTLGHWIGPNADDLYAELAYRPSFWWELRLWGEARRHGANPEGQNVGGDASLPHAYPRDPEYVRFLAGVRERTSTVGVATSYQVVRNAFVALAYTYSWARTGCIGGGLIKRGDIDIVLSLNL
ncbi:MAG: capsule assembly Wzi family protein [candidate division KSB1 bacterium]|nr:capsule assembly Wzi family protein [candidate division KSB1 bacterium]MDZ7385694.1 capsule assembly Wzi family protein [candidate division KSB1 bacterium]MDZ7413213.1 capsule assembly Wzi family protein [candidate division KSB1 bacterium]